MNKDLKAKLAMAVASLGISFEASAL